MIGRGTAGSLAAAAVTRLHPAPDHELHHIYDSRIPTIGVGEGSWPSLVPHLQQLTNLPHETVLQFLSGTRKYGVAFEGWGVRNQDFIHYFTPKSAQLQIGMILQTRLNCPVEHLERDAPVVNRFLVNTMLCYGLFVGWHYSRGSKFDSAFWRHARDHAWPQHRKAAAPEAVDCNALQEFDEMFELVNQPAIDETDQDRMCGVPLTSYTQVSQGLGC